mmetsp:Transcript_17556/g.36886  ORF Transcript_17556/g.36886 Transcript_17556/m.36886 type:complete len:200 (-) Transcript_17556:66-665(-)
MLATVQNLFILKFPTEIRIQISINLAEIAQRSLASLATRFLETSEVQFARRRLEKGHFQMLRDRIIDRNIRRTKGVFGPCEDRSGRGTAVGIAEVGLQCHDGLFEIRSVVDLESSDEDSAVEKHLGFHIRSMGREPLGEEGERVVETGRYDERAGGLVRVEKGNGDLIDGHVGSFGKRYSREHYLSLRLCWNLLRMYWL